MTFLKVCLFSVFILSLSPNVVAEQQATYGNNSPIVSENKGKIIINYRNENKKINNKIWNKERAIKLINKISNFTLNDIISYRWFKLSNNEIYLSTSYRTNDKNFSNDIILLNNAMEEARIFHEVVEGADGTYETAVGSIDGILHVFLYSVGGSGGYLNGNLYKKNEFGYLKKVSSITRDGKHGLSRATVSEFNNKIIINSTGTIYSFRKKEGLYEPYKFIPNVNYPDFGSNVHILKIKLIRNKIVLNFDNEMVKFKKKGNVFISSPKPKINIGDQVIILSEAKVYRIFVTGLDWKNNIFETYVLNNKNNEIDSTSESYYSIYLDILNFPDHHMAFSLR